MILYIIEEISHRNASYIHASVCEWERKCGCVCCCTEYENFRKNNMNEDVAGFCKFLMTLPYQLFDPFLPNISLAKGLQTVGCTFISCVHFHKRHFSY